MPDIFGMAITQVAAYAPPYVALNPRVAARLRLQRMRINTMRRKSGQPLLTPDEEKEFKTNDRWIQRFIGFSSRRFVVDGEGTCDLAAHAAQLLVQRGWLDPNTLDAILFGTVTPSYLNSPPDAGLLHAALGIAAERDGIPIEMYGQDGALACSTWPTMLQHAYARIRSGMSKRILLIGADAMSTAINWEDRAFATVLGDAGTAVLCEAVDPTDDWFGPQLFWSWLGGEYARTIISPKGGSKDPITSAEDLRRYRNRLGMNGRVVKEFFVPFMSERGIDAALRKAGWSLSDIDLAAFHEANRSQINGQVANNWRKRGFQGEVVDANGEFGNTTSASIPLALALNAEKLQPGRRFVWAGFGGGFSASLAFGIIRQPIQVAIHM